MQVFRKDEKKNTGDALTDVTISTMLVVTGDAGMTSQSSSVLKIVKSAIPTLKDYAQYLKLLQNQHAGHQMSDLKVNCINFCIINPGQKKPILYWVSYYFFKKRGTHMFIFIYS